MDNLTKAKVDGAMEEQLCTAKQVEINPSSHMDPAEIPLDDDSPFRVWPKPCYISHGENPINGHGSTFGAADNGNANQVGVAQAAQLNLDHNFNANMDPKKLKRIVSNRISARKSRMKKNFYVADLEGKARILEDQINLLHPQVVGYTNQIQLLNMEKQNLIQKMAVLEEHERIQEAEIEKNKAELHMLRELLDKQYEQQVRAKASVFTWNAGQQLMSNSNSDHSDILYR